MLPTVLDAGAAIISAGTDDPVSMPGTMRDADHHCSGGGSTASDAGALSVAS
jgi:hypothetical protein